MKIHIFESLSSLKADIKTNLWIFSPPFLVGVALLCCDAMIKLLRTTSFYFVIWNKRIVSNSIQSTVSIIPSTFWNFRGLHDRRWVDVIRLLPWRAPELRPICSPTPRWKTCTRKVVKALSSCQERSGQSLGEMDVSDKLGSLKCLGESYSLSFASQPWVSWWNHHHQSLQL